MQKTNVDGDVKTSENPPNCWSAPLRQRQWPDAEAYICLLQLHRCTDVIRSCCCWWWYSPLLLPTSLLVQVHQSVLCACPYNDNSC